MKKLLFFLSIFFPLSASAQVSTRYNHTLRQYNRLVDANNMPSENSISRDETVSSLPHGVSILWAPGGIRKETTVPTVYADGSTGNIEQIGRMADGSIQQTDRDVADGVAGLNHERQITAQMIGDISLAKASNLFPVAVGGVILSDSLDNMYVHNLGVQKSSGVFDAAGLRVIHGAKNLPPVTLHLSADEHYPLGVKIPDSNYNRIFIHADGQLLSPAEEAAEWNGNPEWNGGHLSSHVGDTSLVQDFEPKFGIMRDREYNNNAIFDYNMHRKPASITSDFMTINSQWFRSTNCSSNPTDLWCNGQSMGTSIHNNTMVSTSNVGAGITNNFMKSTGFGGAGGFDVEDFEKFVTGGTNWHWVSVNELDEIDGITPGGYWAPDGKAVIKSGAMNYNNEWDMAGYGPDDPRTAYDPTKSSRIAFWFNTWFPGSEPLWGSEKKYHAFQIIVVTKKDGSKCMYEATVEGGITGKTQPYWAFNETTSAVMDGGQKWVYVGPKRFEIGRVFGIGASDGTQFGTLMSSDAMYYNSLFDFSMARFSVPTHVFARLQKNMYLDMTANGTESGQNNHLLGYDGKERALSYKVNGVSVLKIKDNGSVVSSAPAQLLVMTRAQIRAYPSPLKGMEIYDSEDDTPAIYTDRGWKLLNLSNMPK